MLNLHSLSIPRFIGLADVFEAIFTKAIYITLKSNSLNWLCFCFFLEPASPWPALAFWCSHMQTNPANALEQILSLPSSTGFNPPPLPTKRKKKKKIGKCEGCRIQNVTFCHPHVSCYCGSPSVTWKGNIAHTHRAAHVHTTSRWGRGKWLIIPSASVHAVKQCQGIARTSLLPERRQSAAALRLKTLSKQAEISFYCSAPTLRFGSFTVKWKKKKSHFFRPLGLVTEVFRSFKHVRVRKCTVSSWLSAEKKSKREED